MDQPLRPDVVELLGRLTSPDRSTRHGAALDLSELAEAGVYVPADPFFALMANASTPEFRTTLLFSVHSMDCSAYFREVLDLALNGTFACQNHAMTILEEQDMDVTPEQLDAAEERLRNYTRPSHMQPYEVDAFRYDMWYILKNLRDGLE